MTHKSLFKEAAQRIVQRGQVPEAPNSLQSHEDTLVSMVASGQTRQMNDLRGAANRDHSTARSPNQR